MQYLFDALAICSSVSRKKDKTSADKDASEIQLNAFESRNYKTRLDPEHQKIVERIVNQWACMLVKGKMMKVNNFDEKVMLDRDLLQLECQGDFYRLKAFRKMEFFKTTDDESNDDTPYGLDITFEGTAGDINLGFCFDSERQRLNFALTLRILRTRDPTLDPSESVEIVSNPAERDDKPKNFSQLATTPHYDVEKGISVVFSVSDLKIYTKLRTTSRDVYLEFFVRYPSQDKFLYAKSPTASLLPQVILNEDALARKRKQTREELDDPEEQKNSPLQVEQHLGSDIPLCNMCFQLKNVKIKIPKVPHTIFGRLMARDDFFPTAVMTFEFDIRQAHLQDKRGLTKQEKKRLGEKGGKDDGTRTDPEVFSIPTMCSSSLGEPVKAGLLTLRAIGYVTDARLELERGVGSGKKGPQVDDDEEDEEDGEEAGEEAGEEGDEDGTEGEEDIAGESGTEEGSEDK